MTDHAARPALEQPTARCARAPEVWTTAAPILGLRWRAGPLGTSHDVPVTDAPEVDPRMAMALLEAHEQERSRLAEELHDGPAQALANAIFQTEIVDRALREDPAAARTELLALRRMLERELDTLRGYINQLRPSLGEAMPASTTPCATAPTR